MEAYHRKCCTKVYLFVLIACDKADEITERLAQVQKYVTNKDNGDFHTTYKKSQPSIPII